MVAPAPNLRALLVLPLAIILCGCGRQAATPGGDASPRTLRAADVFSTVMIGQSWTFSNALDDRTFISVEPPEASDFLPAGCVVLHYTKTRGRAYWQPGAGGAELRFVLCPQADGSWAAAASLMHGNTDSGGVPSPWVATQNIAAVPGFTAGYTIIPSSADEHSVGRLVTEYRNYNLAGVETFNAIDANPQTTTRDIVWRTDSYLAQTCVRYQNWCGLALVSEQWENCSTSTWDGQGCVHERWFFAPAIGLVRVDVLNAGNGEDAGFCTRDPDVVQCFTLSQISFQRIS